MKRDYSPENVTITMCGHEIQGFVDGKPFEEVADPLESRGMIGRTVLVVGDYSKLEARMLAHLFAEDKGHEVVLLGTNHQGPELTPEQIQKNIDTFDRFADSFQCRRKRDYGPLVYQMRERLPPPKSLGPRNKWGKLK
jgi:hypothetical protein